MHPMTEKKEQLKGMAKAIRTLKNARKPKSKDYRPGINWEIYSAGRKYRIEHIAYCLVRGKTYEQIEQPKETNRIMEFEWKTINKLHDDLKQKVDKANTEWQLTHPKGEVVNG